MMGAWVNHYSLVLLLGLALSGCERNQHTALPEESIIEGEFPAGWVKQILFANKEFQKTKQDISCFKVKMYEREGMYYISFIPSVEIEVDEDGNVPMYYGYNNPCGQGVKYEFDKSGKFIRKIYSR